MKKQTTLLATTIALSCGGYSATAVSERLNANFPIPIGATLQITAGVQALDANGNPSNVSSGSYFGMDLDGNSKISGTEKTPLVEGQFGIRIGVETTAGASHTGAILPGDTNELDAPWLFSSSTGSGQFVPGAGGPTESSLGIIDMTGYVINWNSNTINVGGGVVWQPGNCAVLGCSGLTFQQGLAHFDWSGVYGDPYVLQYTAVVPTGSFTGTQYYLHFEGTVTAPPNLPPTANAFSVPALSNTSILVDIASNASDPDGNLDPTTVAITSDGSCGTITNNGDGTVSLPACPAGTYTFDYSIADTIGASASATVSVTVSANPPPSAQPDTSITDGVTPVDIDVLTNDATGTSPDPTTVAIATQPSFGSASSNSTTGIITYTANTSFSGIDTFTYTVEDSSATNNVSSPTTVTVTVNALNTPSSDTTYTPGSTAVAAGSTSGVITASDIAVVDDAGSAEKSVIQSCIGGCFDFVLADIVSSEAQVVIPLTTAIPATNNVITYRKLIGSGWQNFDTTGSNAIHTAPGIVSGTDVSCPSVSDPVYNTSTGLTTGHQCVRLTITDNGPNDNDPTTGTIADPGGIAEIGIVDDRVPATSGCSITDQRTSIKDHMEWLLVAGFIGLLGFFGRKDKPLS